jgi:site-specific recombinase XerD
MLRLGRAAELFLAAKEAEGLSARTIGWYRMILDRLVAKFGAGRSIDELTPAELRAWLIELRSSLAPISISGYVRGLRAFANWLATDGLADAPALRTLARPRVPRKIVEPLSDADLHRLLAVADIPALPSGRGSRRENPRRPCRDEARQLHGPPFPRSCP